jgi:hypothetical protein
MVSIFYRSAGVNLLVSVHAVMMTVVVFTDAVGDWIASLMSSFSSGE